MVGSDEPADGRSGLFVCWDTRAGAGLLLTVAAWCLPCSGIHCRLHAGHHRPRPLCILSGHERRQRGAAGGEQAVCCRLAWLVRVLVLVCPLTPAAAPCPRPAVQLALPQQQRLAAAHLQQPAAHLQQPNAGGHEPGGARQPRGPWAAQEAAGPHAGHIRRNQVGGGLCAYTPLLVPMPSRWLAAARASGAAAACSQPGQ